jgi:hypothetical protein
VLRETTSRGLACVFITTVPIIELFARGEGDSGGHVEPTQGTENVLCLLLQYLIQS